MTNQDKVKELIELRAQAKIGGGEKRPFAGFCCGSASGGESACQSANGPNSSKASKCGTISNALPENTP